MREKKKSFGCDLKICRKQLALFRVKYVRWHPGDAVFYRTKFSVWSLFCSAIVSWLCGENDKGFSGGIYKRKDETQCEMIWLSQVSLFLRDQYSYFSFDALTIRHRPLFQIFLQDHPVGTVMERTVILLITKSFNVPLLFLKHTRFFSNICTYKTD